MTRELTADHSRCKLNWYKYNNNRPTASIELTTALSIVLEQTTLIVLNSLEEAVHCEINAIERISSQRVK